MIIWAPATVGEEVAQNVRTLLKTEPGSVPLARAMGTPQDALDTPQSVAGARLQADVIRAVRTYEPRVKVKRVRVTATADGVLAATAEHERVPALEPHDRRAGAAVLDEGGVDAVGRALG